MTSRAIETMYRGCLFRSRLEARWAAFFDLLGWRWTYEPTDEAGWIPDFLLHGGRPVLVEVKPAVLPEDLQRHEAKIDAALAALGTTAPDVVLVGVTPSWVSGQVGRVREASSAAWGGWAAATWHVCSCGRYGFHCATGSYQSRPCGCYDGDRHLAGEADEQHIERLWNNASNCVRWVPK